MQVRMYVCTHLVSSSNQLELLFCIFSLQNTKHVDRNQVHTMDYAHMCDVHTDVRTYSVLISH